MKRKYFSTIIAFAAFELMFFSFLMITFDADFSVILSFVIEKPLMFFIAIISHVLSFYELSKITKIDD